MIGSGRARGVPAQIRSAVSRSRRVHAGSAGTEAGMTAFSTVSQGAVGMGRVGMGASSGSVNGTRIDAEHPGRRASAAVFLLGTT